jgi:hypothetical protein
MRIRKCVLPYTSAPTVALIVVSSTLSLAGVACCPTPWTARICTQNNSGQCQPTDPALKHELTVSPKSLGPVPDAQDPLVHATNCANGIGEVDVRVVKQDKLEVTVFCRNDSSSPHPRVTLPGADAGN